MSFNFLMAYSVVLEKEIFLCTVSDYIAVKRYVWQLFFPCVLNHPGVDSADSARRICDCRLRKTWSDKEYGVVVISRFKEQ